MNARTWAVSELIRAINAQLSGAFGEVWVRGELSGVKVATSGHRYFQLKDADGQLSCAMWSRSAERLRFRLADGLAVLARATVEVYAQRGSLQLIVQEVVPEGVGELQLAFAQLKEKLERDGLFAGERKRPLPALPLRLGLVTSPTGAAVRDVLSVLTRWPHLFVLLYPVRVQGRGAEGEIARAVRYLGRSALVDAILVVRGGGSLEDLWAFNEEIVARAVFDSPVPVISGVGHEVDFTIADFVADIRAATPTQAAEIVVQHLERQQRRVDDGARRITQSFERRLDRAQLRLRGAEGARGLARLPARLRELRARLERLEALPARLQARVATHNRRLDGAVAVLYRWPVRLGAPRRRELLAARLAVAAARLRALLRRRQLELASAERALAALSPDNVLQRGYSITVREGDPRPLRDAADAAAGTHLVTRLAHGQLRSLVLGRDAGAQQSLFDGEGPAQPTRAECEGDG